MPWCPKCRTEYRKGYNTCSDCESELVEELEQAFKNDEYEYDREAYLTSVTNSFEADMLTALLKSNGIPVLEKTRGTGGYTRIYMGLSLFGVDLYVPSKMLEQAKELIEGRQEILTDELTDEFNDEMYNGLTDREQRNQDDEQEISWSNVYDRNRRARSLIFIFYAVPMLICFIVVVIKYIMHLLLIV